MSWGHFEQRPNQPIVSNWIRQDRIQLKLELQKNSALPGWVTKRSKNSRIFQLQLSKLATLMKKSFFWSSVFYTRMRSKPLEKHKSQLCQTKVEEFKIEAFSWDFSERNFGSRNSELSYAMMRAWDKSNFLAQIRVFIRPESVSQNQ